MDRPHGHPRWAILLLACVALFAVAMVPRGMVRATVASELGAPVPAAGEHLDSREEPGRDLPGVRVVVSREEQGVDAADAALTSPTVHVERTDTWEPLDGTEPLAAPEPDLTRPSSPRAPPPSI